MLCCAAWRRGCTLTCGSMLPCLSFPERQRREHAPRAATPPTAAEVPGTRERWRQGARAACQAPDTRATSVQLQPLFNSGHVYIGRACGMTCHEHQRIRCRFVIGTNVQRSLGFGSRRIKLGGGSRAGATAEPAAAAAWHPPPGRVTGGGPFKTTRLAKNTHLLRLRPGAATAVAG